MLSKTLTHIDAYEMNNFVSGMLDYFRKNYAALCDRIEKTGVLSADDRASIIEIAGKFAETYEGSEAGR